MPLREQDVELAFLDDPVRLVFDALTPLVAHDVLLGREVLRGETVGQIAHAVRLEPQRQLELIRRNRLEVVGPIEVGRAVQIAGARGFEHADVRVGRHVLRALEHHVLEQVREAGAAGVFVGRSDVIPEVHRDEREPVVLGEDDSQPVGKGIHLVFEIRNVARRWLSHGPQRDTEEHGDGESSSQSLHW
jgi:hypothetical protein